MGTDGEGARWEEPPGCEEWEGGSLAGPAAGGAVLRGLWGVRGVSE